MDGQFDMYYILKNGKRMEQFSARPLQNIIWLINELEKGLDRLKQHSPYTIGKEENWEVKQ